MTSLLNLSLGGNPLSFNSDGTVTGAANAAAGTWTTQSASGTNGIAYTPIAGPAQAITVAYGMNANNQLTVGVPAQGGLAAAAPAPIEGFIALEAASALTYCAIENDDPDEPSFTFYVYGALAINPGGNSLSVTNPDGTHLQVAGVAYSGSTALSVGQADAGLDLITFNAVTQNPLAAGGTVDIPAEISIPGLWDVSDGQVKFGAVFDSTSGTPQYAIAVAGTIKGVAAGFEFYSTGGAPRLLFTLQGQIKGTDNQGNWNLSIGYANSQLTATGAVTDSVVLPDGSLTLAGNFTITKGTAPLTFGVNLQAAWKMGADQVSVTVNGSAGSYTLALAGTLVIDKNWDVNFQVTQGSGGNTAFSISVGNGSPGGKLYPQLKAYYSGHSLTLSAGTSLSFTFVNGKLLPTPAATTPPASSAT
jgi:hypothetical protein